MLDITRHFSFCLMPSVRSQAATDLLRLLHFVMLGF